MTSSTLKEARYYRAGYVLCKFFLIDQTARILIAYKHAYIFFTSFFYIVCVAMCLFFFLLVWFY